MRKHTIITITSTLIIGLFLVGRLPAQNSTSNITTPIFFPNAIPLNTTRVVTVAVPLYNLAVASSGVNLLRLNGSSTNPTILGQMQDEGKNGDVAAGDGVYTLQVVFSERQVETIQLQVSAVIRGQLKRAVSVPFDIFITSNGSRLLPPDPGSAGLSTLAGIDSDGDGVRDDVERYIATAYPSSTKDRLALTQAALALQANVVGTAQSYQMLSKAIDCLDYTFTTGDTDETGGRAAYMAYLALRSSMLNTPARTQAFLQADAASGSAVTQMAPWASQGAHCLLSAGMFSN